MITINMVKQGYKRNLIRLIDSPHGDGAVCEIGEYWFYFGGQTAEECSAEEYKANIPEDDIIKEIFGVLNEFMDDPAFEYEYPYYEAILRENGCA